MPKPHSRTGNPSATWRAAVHKARENTKAHYSSTEVEALLWRQGFGAVATARMLDWYCSCHPDVIEADRKAAGFVSGTVQEFLGATDEEMKAIEKRIAAEDSANV